MHQKELEIKSKTRLDINLSLLAISFTIFAIIVSFNPLILKQFFLIPLQLTLAIPLLLSSIFARSKMPFTSRPGMWEEYGFFTFLLAYSFLINVLGMLLSVSIGLSIGLIFLIFNIVISIIYSVLEVVENKSKLSARIKKDLLFLVLIVLGGIIPAIIFV